MVSHEVPVCGLKLHGVLEVLGVPAQVPPAVHAYVVVVTVWVPVSEHTALFAGRVHEPYTTPASSHDTPVCALREQLMVSVVLMEPHADDWHTGSSRVRLCVPVSAQNEVGVHAP